MAVELAFAEAGEVFGRIPERWRYAGCEEFAGIGNCFARLGRDGSRTLTLREDSNARSRTGAKSRLNPRCGSFLPAVGRACGKVCDRRWRRHRRGCRAEHVAKAVHAPPSRSTQVTAEWKRISGNRAASARSARGFYVAREEDYAGGLRRVSREVRRGVISVASADDEEWPICVRRSD